MKKSLLIVSLTIFLFTSKANAQTFNSSNLTFGVKAGLNVARLSILDISEKIKSVMKPMVGVYGNYLLDDNWSLRAELLYAGAGTKSEANENNYTYSRTISLSYLYVPILGKYQISTIPLSFSAGPQFGFLLAHNEKTNDPYGNLSSPEEYRSLEMSLVIGAEYGVNDQINIGLRYQSGLTSIFNDDPLGAVKNRILTLSLGYTF